MSVNRQVVPAAPSEPVQAVFHFATATALSIPADYDYVRWSALASGFNEARKRIGHKAIHWYLGDWMLHGECHIGQEYTQALDDTGYDVGTLQTDIGVAKAFAAIRRRDSLSFEHHRLVRYLDPEKQDEWLDRSERESLTTAQLRRLLQDAGDIKKRETSGAARRAKKEVRLTPARMRDLMTAVGNGLEASEREYASLKTAAKTVAKALRKNVLPFPEASVLRGNAKALRDVTTRLIDDLDTYLSAEPPEPAEFAPTKRRGKQAEAAPEAEQAAAAE